MRNLTFLFIILFISSCSTKPEVVEPQQPYNGHGNIPIYVVNHGWHTGLVVPAKNVFEHIPELSKRFHNATYIEFGWGDKGFYQAKEITTSLTLHAIFYPTKSVVHAVGISHDIPSYFLNSESEILFLNDKEISLLIKFISGSMARDSNKLIATKLGIYGDSQFYKGVGSYHLTNTCNKWTAKGLKSFGMDISPTFKLTSGSVMSYIKEHKSVISQLNKTKDSLSKDVL